jgi:hypothetical protein
VCKIDTSHETGGDLMARVEWARHSGEDVESAVGMLLCSQFPNAVRVRPSQGDGGIDIFIPGPAGPGKERAVYQVKNFSKNLHATEKRAIKKSFERAVETAAEEGWRITEWHLVMPLDLTDKNLGWLDQIIQGFDFPYEVNGLIYCDTLAANYPKVIDYYFRDGKERLAASLNDLTAIIAGRDSRRAQDEQLRPTDVTKDLAAIHRSLNASDPFYKYSFSVDDEPPSDVPDVSKPGLVASYSVRQNSVWVTIDISALSNGALLEQPIEWNVRFDVPREDDEMNEQVRKFFDYGTPLSLPEGTVSGSVSLPGGLGGDIGGGSLTVVSVLDEAVDDAEDNELKLTIHEPTTNAVIAAVDIRRVDWSTGVTGGFRSVWADPAELFRVEFLAKGEKVTAQLKANSYDLSGRVPSKVLGGMQFMAAMHAPNRLGVGLPYGPPDFSIMTEFKDEPDEDREAIADIASVLTDLQEYSSTRLLMPVEITRGQFRGMHTALKLLRGEPIEGDITGGFDVHHQSTDIQFERQPDVVYEFAAIKDIKIELDSTTVTLGKEALFFLGRFSEIEDERSRIEPVSRGVGMKYSGDLEVTRVVCRLWEHGATQGAAAEVQGDNAPASEPMAIES